MTTRNLFATPLYQASLAAEKGFDDFIDELHDACIAVAEEDEAGQAWAQKPQPTVLTNAQLKALLSKAESRAVVAKRLASVLPVYCCGLYSRFPHHDFFS